MAKIEALRNRVVIKKDTPDEKTQGGIIIPDEAKDKPITGTVLSVGPGKVLENGLRQPMEVAVGDRVLFNKYSGINPVIDGEEVFVVPIQEVLATLVYE